MTPVDRGLGTGCVLLPCALFLLAMMFGGMLAHGPQPDGRIGQEPTRPVLVFGLMASGGLVAYVAARFATDAPVGKGSGKVVLGGAVLLTALLGAAFNSSAPAWIAWLLPATGLAGWLIETRSERADNLQKRIVLAPPPAAVVRGERLFFGRLATVIGTGLATAGVWLAWPRDPTKTTAAHWMTLFVGTSLLAWGMATLRYVWRAGRPERYVAGWTVLWMGVTSTLWSVGQATAITGPTLQAGGAFVIGLILMPYGGWNVLKAGGTD